MQEPNVKTQDNQYFNAHGTAIRTLTLNSDSCVTEKSYQNVDGQWVCFKRVVLPAH